MQSQYRTLHYSALRGNSQESGRVADVVMLLSTLISQRGKTYCNVFTAEITLYRGLL